MGFWDAVLNAGISILPGGAAVQAGAQAGIGIAKGFVPTGGGGGGSPISGGSGANVGRQGHTYEGRLVIKDPGGQQWLIVGRAGGNAVIEKVQDGTRAVFSPLDLPDRSAMEWGNAFPVPVRQPPPRPDVPISLPSGGQLIPLIPEESEAALLDQTQFHGVLPPTSGEIALSQPGAETVFVDASLRDVTPRQIGELILDPTVERIGQVIETVFDDPTTPRAVPPNGQVPVVTNGAQPHIATDQGQFERADTEGERSFPDFFLASTVCYAPKGYVVVRDRFRRRWFMKRSLALQKKLFKARRKPPILASEMACIRTAKRVTKKVDKIFKEFGTKPKTRRSARTTRSPSYASDQTQVIKVD